MPTHKNRINITVPDDIDRAVQKLAERDHTSLSAKTLELIRRALEIEEDAALLGIASERDRGAKQTEYLAHDQVWG